jgi:hypothetical protein
MKEVKDVERSGMKEVKEVKWGGVKRRKKEEMRKGAKERFYHPMYKRLNRKVILMENRLISKNSDHPASHHLIIT